MLVFWTFKELFLSILYGFWLFFWYLFRGNLWVFDEAAAFLKFDELTIVRNRPTQLNTFI